MRLGAAFQQTILGGRPQSIEGLAGELTDKVILKCCEQAGCQDQRRRKLPVEVLVWLVIGMALFRDRCIEAVAAHLHLWSGPTAATDGALAQRRQLVGPEPLRAVFQYTGKEWALASAQRHAWRGLALFGVDGMCLRVADTQQNEDNFGRPPSPRSKNQSGYPQLRLAGLMALRSHLLVGVEFGPYRAGETNLAKKLWPLSIDHSLVIIDKGFIDYGLFHRLLRSGVDRNLLVRARKNAKWEVIQRLGPGDLLVDVSLSAKLRREDPTLPEKLRLRAVRYQRPGYSVQWLLTSLLDATQYPAAEVGALYHVRWEQELGWDEIKTHTLDQEESLRSKSPRMVEQEVWGLCIAYNLVRRQMEKFAEEQGIEPNRVSYRNALLVVRNTCLSAAKGVGGMRPLLDALDAELKLLVLPERRSERAYPRHVKLKSKKYKRNPGRPQRVSA
jgi:hypothetical protein